MVAPSIQPADYQPSRRPSTKFILVQLIKCVIVCGFILQIGHSGDGCLSSLILFKYECRMGHLFVLSWVRVRWVVLFRCDLR